MTSAESQRTVVHLLNSTDMGGAEVMAARLAEQLLRHGWQSEVVTLRGEGSVSTILRRIGIPVSSLNVPASQGVIAIRRALSRWLKAHQPAVLHTHNLSPLIAAALTQPRLHKISVVHTKHGHDGEIGIGARFLRRHATRLPVAIACVSEVTMRLAVEEEGYPRQRCRVVHNGITLGAPVDRAVAPCLRFLQVARLEPVKAVEDTLAAIAHLRASGIPATLTIAGDGSEGIRLAVAAERLGLGSAVTFLGWQDALDTIYRQADVFVLSSRSEGLSLAMLEAMGSGLPVIATAVGGNPEIVSNGETGMLVPPRDPVALANAMRTMCSDPAKARRMGEAGRQKVESDFSIDHMTRQYLALYGEPRS